MMEARMKKINQESKVLNILFFCTLVFQDAGTFGLLPLNLFQIIELIMLVIMCVYNPKIRIERGLIGLFAYIGILTIINPFDMDSIKTFVFLILSVTMYHLFLQRVPLQMTIETIFNSALLLSLYGCIQEFGYLLKIPEIYDISTYGFTLNGLDIGHGNLMRVNSLYAEPAHLGPILGIGVLIGLIENRSNKKIKIWKTVVIMVCALMTQSFLTYASVIMAIVCFVLFYQDGIKRKLKWVLLATLMVVFLCVSQWDLVYSVIGRLSQFKTLQTDTGNDLSALAITSNFQVAVEKIKDGYWFGTGLDSHRLYYDRYIDRLYSFLYMRLNSEDAASLYIRIFSEFGVVGLVALCVYLIKKFIEGMKSGNKILVLIILMFSTEIMRDGSYMQPLTQIMILCIMYHKSLGIS